MSCGFCHVGPNPIKPPADPNNPEWANLSSNVGAQYFWVDRIFFQAADFRKLRVSAVSRLAAGLARHVIRLHRQHQQSADDERGVSARSAAASREALGQGNAQGRQPRQPPVQRLPERGPLAQLFQRPDIGLDAARAEGWLRFGRRHGRAEPRLPEHRHVQRRMADALQPARRRHSRSRRSRSRSRARTRRTSRPPKRRRSTWRGSS